MKQLLSCILMILTTTVFGQVEQKENPTDFLPKGYVVFERINGDLNKDALEDCVLIIKGTDKSKIITDEHRGQLDRNRRGIVVLFRKGNHYELAVKNYDCFSSENEDGGAYFPPELDIEIKKNKLYVHYAHGRYGYVEYTFRFQNSDFELIGYDSGDRSSFQSEYVTFDETSVNFSTKKELVKKVIKVNPDGEDVYKETWKNININKLLKLSEIVDFEELEISY